jgi:hypothetical protein
MSTYQVYLDDEPIRSLRSEALARSALEAEAAKLKGRGMRLTALPGADSYLVTDLLNSSVAVLWFASGETDLSSNRG